LLTRYLFQIVSSFLTFTFHKVVKRRLYGVMGSLIITQSLQSTRVKQILKIGQHLPKLWAINYRVVFYETRCMFPNFCAISRFFGQTCS